MLLFLKVIDIPGSFSREHDRAVRRVETVGESRDRPAVGHRDRADPADPGAGSGHAVPLGACLRRRPAARRRACPLARTGSVRQSRKPCRASRSPRRHPRRPGWEIPIPAPLNDSRSWLGGGSDASRNPNGEDTETSVSVTEGLANDRSTAGEHIRGGGQGASRQAGACWPTGRAGSLAMAPAGETAGPRLQASRDLAR